MNTNLLEYNNIFRHLHNQKITDKFYVIGRISLINGKQDWVYDFNILRYYSTQAIDNLLKSKPDLYRKYTLQRIDDNPELESVPGPRPISRPAPIPVPGSGPGAEPRPGAVPGAEPRPGAVLGPGSVPGAVPGPGSVPGAVPGPGPGAKPKPKAERMQTERSGKANVNPVYTGATQYPAEHARQALLSQQKIQEKIEKKIEKKIPLAEEGDTSGLYDVSVTE